MAHDWQPRANELASEATRNGEPTAWFEQLYREGVEGRVEMAWDRPAAHPLLADWTGSHVRPDEDRTAIVVGCGMGADAEHLASLGFTTIGFDLAPSVIEAARERHAGGSVEYWQADLLEVPPPWRGSFDVVVEVFTLQAVPDPPRAAMAAGVRSLVAPGGTLLAIQFRTDRDRPSDVGPPYALDRATMESLGADGLQTVAIEKHDGPMWRAEYVRA